MEEYKEELQTERDPSSKDSACADETQRIVLGHGNPIPEIVTSFLVIAVFLSLGFFFLIGDVNLTPEIFGSQTVTKIFAFSIMLGIAWIFIMYAIALCKRLKLYYKQKRESENEAAGEPTECEIAQRTCPQCGDVHDVDYPKCPVCRFEFFE